MGSILGLILISCFIYFLFTTNLWLWLLLLVLAVFGIYVVYWIGKLIVAVITDLIALCVPKKKKEGVAS